MIDNTDEYIFQTSKQTNTIENSTVNDLFYTISEYASSTTNDGYYLLNTDSNQHVYAKKINREDGTVKYLIKTDTRGRLFNPISIYGQENNTNFLDKTCKDTKFRSVNFRTFDMYVKFLATKNLSWLHNAEREAE